MQRRMLLVLLAVLLMPAAAWAQCSFPVHVVSHQQSGEEYTLTWDPVPGATAYSFIETTASIDSGFEGGNERTIGASTSLTRTHYATQDYAYDYLVRAYGAADPYTPICSGRTRVFINGDANLHDFVNRGIIPVAGSAPGAYGARFKTYLRLVSTGGNSKGTIYFHPAGQRESDTDPSMRFELTKEMPQLEWDDVVAAIGASGIGSLAIIPDPNAYFPRVDVRVYNDGPDGKFGSAEQVYFPQDFLTTDGITRQQILYSDASLRLNIGAVTLYDKTHALVTVITPEGKVRGGLSRTLLFRDAGMYLSSLEAYQINAQPGDTINIYWDKPTIGFHTRTDNQTNDPFIYVIERPSTSGGPGYFIQ